MHASTPYNTPPLSQFMVTEVNIVPIIQVRILVRPFFLTKL